MDSRRAPRVSIMAELRYPESAGGTTILKRVTDIGESGVFVDTPVPSDVGTELELRLHLDGRLVVAEGRVAFAQAFIGMGVEFTGMDAESRARVRAFVARLRPEAVAV